MMTEKKLLELKKEIETAKSTLSELKGREGAIKERLKEDFGCNTIEEAYEKQKKMVAEIENLEEKLEQKLDELEQALEELNDEEND